MLAGVHRTQGPAASGGPRRVGRALRESALTRRSVLAGSAVAGLALLVGCTSDPAPAPSGSSSQPEPDADAPVRASVASDEAAIIALYDAVLAAYPGLSADLAPLRDEHIAHAEAMASPTGPAATPAAPGSQPRALAALIEAEQQAIAQRTSACEASTGADIARTIALIAASEAGHAEFLRGLT